MLTAIVLTATLTAAAVMALFHRSGSYVYNLEQTAMNQAEELQDLRRELTDTRSQVTGLIASNSIYRTRLRQYEPRV